MTFDSLFLDMSQGKDSSSTQDLYERKNDLRNGEVNYNIMQRPTKKKMTVFFFSMKSVKLWLFYTVAPRFALKKKKKKKIIRCETFSFKTTSQYE